MAPTDPHGPNHPVPSSVDDVGDFTITGTLKSDDPRDIKVVTDPSAILSDYFTADVLDFRKELEDTTEEMTEEELDEKTMPRFMGDRVKWSIETYLVDYDSGGTNSDDGVGSKDTQSWAPDGSSAGSSEYASDDDDTNSSQVSDLNSSKTSAGSSRVGGKTYPPHTTRNLKAGEPMHFEYKGAPHPRFYMSV